LHALEQGNVVLVYGGASAPPALRALQEELAGPYDKALVEAGQLVLLDREPGATGVVALAWRRMLRAPTAQDPQLRAFVEAHLGRGAAQ
jgi:hypothetical protein